MSTTISIRLPCRPVEGCALRAQGLLRSNEYALEEVELRWRWLRGEKVVPNCAYQGCDFAYDYDPVSVSRRGTALQCVACLKAQRGSNASSLQGRVTFCSARCFVKAWPTHKERHVWAKPTCEEATTGSWRLRANSEGAASDDSVGLLGRPRGAGSAPYRGTNGQAEASDEDYVEAWELLANGSAEVLASGDEVGRRLRVECYGIVLKSEQICARGFAVTEPVLAAPGPGPERRWYGEQPSPMRDDGDRRIRIASYNVLAEIYATSNMYPYCPRWALDWQYRVRRVVDEINDSDPDVLCLQEAQRDLYERDLLPALEAQGYEGTFAQKSREAMGAAGKVDGCAMFWKRTRFRLAEHRTVSFNDIARSEAAALSLSDGDEHAFLLRLVKDNVAHFSVLESYDPRGPRRLCVANTHLYSNKESADTKLWQALHLLRELERFVHRSHRDHFALILAGDFNSVVQSAVYDLLVDGMVDPSHNDLQHFLTLPATYRGGRPPNVLPDPRDISHRLNLASAYHVALGTEPPYTNFTLNFQGTLDYILFDPNSLRCLAVAQIPGRDEIRATGQALPNAQYPSDHLMLLADFLCPI